MCTPAQEPTRVVRVHSRAVSQLWRNNFVVALGIRAGSALPALLALPEGAPPALLWLELYN